jgi:allantoicase
MSFVTQYSELRNDFVDDGKVHIDGWETEDDNEEGKVLAIVDLETQRVEFRDEEAQQTAQVHEFIKETINQIKNGEYGDY